MKNKPEAKVIDMTEESLKEFKLTPEQEKIARSMGFNGMFACRETVQECYDYVAQMKGREALVATTGLAMLQNFLAIHVAKNFVPVEKKG